MRLIQDGPRKTNLVIVGEAPGANENKQGIPFIGGAGELLNRMLSASGINRQTAFVTNVCHTQPPGNEFKYFFTKAGEPDLYRGIIQLRNDLTEIRPNLVLALGGQALQVLTGKKGITQWRGSILPCTLVPGLKVIGTIHPAAILRQYDFKAVAEFDLRRASEDRKFPELRYPERTLYLPIDGRHQIVRRVDSDWVNGELVESDRVVYEMLQATDLAIDIECWQRDDGSWMLACVGFSDRADRALVLRPTDSGSINAIRALLGSPARKVLQNGTFDKTVLEQEGYHMENFGWDTMIAHHTLYAESASGKDEMAELNKTKRTAALQKGLAFQTSIYTREPYYKADGKLWKQDGDLQVFWRYNALDVAVTREIKDVQEQELAEFGVAPAFEASMSLVQPAMDATRHGIRVDVAKRDALKQEVMFKVNNLQKFIDEYVGSPLNVKSPKQMAAFLYDRLQLPVQRNAAGNPSADKDALVALGIKSANPFLHTIIELRQQRDLVERYLDVPIGADLRMRCAFDLTGTRSGRLSSRASLDGTGTNLQNQPEELRSMFMADPGTSFVYRDYSQAEARVVAYLARCQGLIELFEDPNRDIHTENAARIFGHKEARLEKYGGPVTSTQRYLAKRVVHASNYGMAPPRLVEVVNEDTATTGVRITLPEARSLIEKYFLLYPEIKENFWYEVEQELRRTRILNTHFSRRRMFFGRWDDKLLREAYSYIPQSTVGDLARIAWVRIAEALKQRPELRGIVLLNVHDSILVQCASDAVAEVAPLMASAMDIPITVHGRTFTIPTDCKVGTNWGNQSESNPNGLVEYGEGS